MNEGYASLAIDYTKELLAIDSPTGMTAKAEQYVVDKLSDMGTRTRAVCWLTLEAKGRVFFSPPT